MKLTKSETEKMRIALFKLVRGKPTVEIAAVADHLAQLLDAEEHRQFMAANPAPAVVETPPLIDRMEGKK